MGGGASVRVEYSVHVLFKRRVRPGEIRVMNDMSTLATLVRGAGKWTVLGTLFAGLAVVAPSCSSDNSGSDSNGSSSKAGTSADDGTGSKSSSGGKSSGNSSGGASSAEDAGSAGTDEGNSTGGARSSSGGSMLTDVTFADACPDFETDYAACGSSATAAQQVKVNVLLVVDKSGSMDSTPDGYSQSLWLSVTTALANVLGDVEDRINFGLELYPFPQTDSVPIDMECGTADNCCEMPLNDTMNVEIGPGADNVELIVQTLEDTAPGGGTPTAEALRRALRYLQAENLDGETFVVLATDGGPNCNAEATCGIDECTMNIAGSCEGDSINCCEPVPTGCLDTDDTRSAIMDLANDGVHTYVVGIPGSEPYEPALNEFAVAGRVPNIDPDDPDAPQFYQVSAAGGVNALQETFQRITEQLVTSCVLPLADPPDDPQRVNVAIDCTIIPQKGADGLNQWILSDDGLSVEILDDRCETITSNGVDRIDVLLGCPPLGLG